MGQLLPEGLVLPFHQYLPERGGQQGVLVGERETYITSKVICWSTVVLKIPSFTAAPHCPSVLVTKTGNRKRWHKRFQFIKCRQTGWQEQGRRWPHYSPWTLPIYLVLFLLPYWIVALLTHLYARHYRYSLPHESIVLPTEVYHTHV